MKIFSHHIYEYKKGLRNLVLCTMEISTEVSVRKRLERDGIDFLILPVKGGRTFNVFFGANECIETIKSFNKERLNELTIEQDFILGIMLGYDRLKQCERFLQLKLNEQIKAVPLGRVLQRA